MPKQKPTPEEVAAEIAALQALKPFGPFKEKTTAAIALIVETLKHGIDQTADEWNDLSDEEQDHALMSLAWKDGQRTEKPSEGWEGLAST